MWLKRAALRGGTQLHDVDYKDARASFSREATPSTKWTRVKFFAMPPGLQVVVGGAHIGVVGEAGEIQQMPGSYLQELNKVLQQHASAPAQSSPA